MRPWPLVALGLSLALLPTGPAAAQPDLGANAAMKYWQAFALLPALDMDQEKVLQDWDKAPLDAAVLKLIEKSRPSRVYLHRGAQLPRCDWSLDYDDGFFLLVAHIPKVRTLARLAALHARHEFEQGHGKAGWDDVTDLLRLARHVETDPLMINQLVGYSIEAIAIEAAAPYLPQLKPILPATAPETLPAGPTLAQLVLKEKQVGPVWLIRELRQAEKQKEGSWQDVWKTVLAAPAEGERVDPELVKSAKTFDQAVRRVEDLLPLYDELAKLVALPWKEFDARYPEFFSKAKAANPLAGAILPAMQHFVASQRRAETRRALFKAALAVVQGGPDRLKGIPDPSGDGPFEYRALDPGFELRSKLIVNGHPLTLTAGKGKKQ
jgi:hypothetical protein